MASVGVDWEAPLSAASYREWHDRQVSVSDEVRKEDENRLTLVTKLSNGPIQEESLTVRASDFHPIERTIETRAYGTIEIAELSYAVLDWSGVNEALFEPLTTPIHAHPALLPALPTAAELDSAELSARLALNRLHADEGEQISISRTDRAIEVKGVVETNERKHDIVSKLRQLPHVTAEVLSIPELQANPRDSSVAQSIRMQSVDAQPSPLEKYLDAEGNRKTELADSSQRLLDAALKVRQSAAELTTVEKKFASPQSSSRDSAFSQLTQSYAGRLLAGLDSEASTLDALGFTRRQRDTPDVTSIDLAAEVDHNEALCRELIAGSAGPTRQTSEIVPELYESITKIRLAMTAAPKSAK
jgi:hypothetical protein